MIDNYVVKIKTNHFFVNLMVFICAITFIIAVTANFRGIGFTSIKNRYALNLLTNDQEPKNTEANNLVYDFLAKKELGDELEFHWIESSGDLLTVTNLGSKEIKGKISFDIEKDPCAGDRIITIGNSDKPLNLYLTEVKKQEKVELFIFLNAFESSFHSVGSPTERICKFSNGDKRIVIAKIKNVKIETTP
jgi:hypothetical protein